VLTHPIGLGAGIEIEELEKKIAASDPEVVVEP